MLSTLNLVSSLLLGVAFLMIGSGGLTTILSYRMGEVDYPTWIVGLVTAMYFVGLVVGPGFCHRLISSVGHIRTFTALGSLMSAATLAHIISTDALLWGVLRLVVGFCTVGMYMCTESWLNEKSSNEMRGQVFSLYQIVLYLAQAGGQFLINFPDDTGILLYVITSALMSLAIIPVALTRVPAPELPKPQRFDLIKLWRTSQTGMSTSMAAGAIMGAFYGLGALYAQQRGLDRAGTAQFMGIVIFGGLLLQWPIGKLSDIMDRRRVIAGVAISTFIVCVLLQFDLGNGIGLLIFGAMFGGLSFTIYPLAVAYTNDFLSPEDLVPAAGGLMIAYGVGAALGPVVGAPVMDLFGPQGLFIFVGTLAVALFGFILWRITQRETVPLEEQCDYQMMQRTTAVAYEMHPYVEAAEDQNETQDQAEPIANARV